jgi:enoyl-CoA hydratase
MRAFPGRSVPLAGHRLLDVSFTPADALDLVSAGIVAEEVLLGLILTGGPDCFSAGFDLKETLATDFRAFVHRAVEFTERTYFFAKPLVAAVAGPALAGGFDLALSADVVVAADGASLGRPEIRLGINPLLTKLSLRIGMARARRPSLTGEILTAQQAHALGLVDRVVPAAELLTAARQEAARIAGHPLPALLALKRAARAVPFLDARSAVEYEFGLTAALLAEGSARDALREYARALGIATTETDGP